MSMCGMSWIALYSQWKAEAIIGHDGRNAVELLEVLLLKKKIKAFNLAVCAPAGGGGGSGA